jgi:hypothetical protein
MVSVSALRPTLVKSTAVPRESPFQVEYGNSRAGSTLTWGNRSVAFEGDNHVTSGCRKVLLEATGADGSWQTRSSNPLCVAPTRSFTDTFDFSAVVGGAVKVTFAYEVSEDGGVTYQSKAAATCTRGGCA